MNSEMVKSQSELKDPNNNDDNNNSNNETISVRLARYLEHIRHVKKETTKNLLQEAETRLVQQQDLHKNDLEELREQYETQLQVNRDNMEKVLKAKLKLVEVTSQCDKEALEHATKTLSFNNNLISESESRVKALEEANFTLNETIRNLQASLEIENVQANRLDNEVERLQKELASKVEQYQQINKEEMNDLLGLEIAAFDDLLSREEKRIKLMSSTS